MKNFSEEFLKRVQAGDCGMIPWLPVIEDPKSKFEADCHLANWLAYLDFTGYFATAKAWRSRARALHPAGLTLPDRDPWAYDSKYIPPHGERNPWRGHPSDLWIEKAPGKHANEQTLEERRATVEAAMIEVRKAARHMEMFPYEPKGKGQQAAPPPAKTLEDLKHEAVENPVKMSPALAARLNGEK